MMNLENASTTDAVQTGGAVRNELWAWIIITVIVIISATIRARLLDLPLERDEGEYAYAGQLMMHGVPSFGHVYNMKMPGVYAAYTVILFLFGETTRGIHLGFTLVNAVSIILLFCLTKRLFDRLTGVLAAAAFAVLSMGQQILGLAGHAAHLVTMFALAGLLCAVGAADTKRPWRYLFSGVLFGLAFTMKQPGAIFGLLGLIVLAVHWGIPRKGTWRQTCLCFGLFGTGAAAPTVLVFLCAWMCGHFGKFWFWTFQYLEQYGSQVTPREGLTALSVRLREVVPPSALLWGMACLGLTVAFWDKSVRKSALLASGFALASIGAICPGFYFRSNYFNFLTPAIALMAAVGVVALGRLVFRQRAALRATLAVSLLGIGVCHTLYTQRHYLFEWSPMVACRQTYAANPFPESPEIAQYIRNHTTPADTVAVIGSEPQIYFYSQRRAATGYVYTYALMERHPFARKMQEEMISEITAARPKYMVFVGVSGSWLGTPESDRLIFDWAGDYMREQYFISGLAEITPDRGTIWLWGREAAEHKLKYSYCLILERKDLTPG